MLRIFSRYFSVGIVNTCLHWVVFLLLHAGGGVSQALSNFLAFSVAVTFSFFANSWFTFKAKATLIKYFLFVSMMGVISFTVGAIADDLSLPALVTLVAFSGISLVLGFVFSNWIVFKRRM